MNPNNSGAELSADSAPAQPKSLLTTHALPSRVLSRTSALGRLSMSFSLEELEGALKEKPNREDWSAFLADKGRRTHLVTGLVPLCQTEAARLERKLGRREGELVSTTYFAAVSLLEKYDPTRSDSLVKYVVSLIRNRVIEQLRLEEGRFTDKRVIDRAVSSLSNRFERPVLPTEPIVVDEINKNLRTKRVEEAGKPPREWTTAKLHSRVAHFESKPVLATDQFGLDGELSIDTAFSNRAIRERGTDYTSADQSIDVRTLLDRLPAIDRFIVTEALLKGRAFKEVGASLTPPVSESRISQRYTKAMTLLQLSEKVGTLLRRAHLTEDCRILPASVKTFLQRHQRGTLHRGKGRRSSMRLALRYYARALELLRQDGLSHYLPSALHSAYAQLSKPQAMRNAPPQDCTVLNRQIAKVRRARQYLQLIESFSARNHARLQGYLSLLEPNLSAVFRSAFLKGNLVEDIAKEVGVRSPSFVSQLINHSIKRISFIARLDRDDNLYLWQHVVPRLPAEQQRALHSVHKRSESKEIAPLNATEFSAYNQGVDTLVRVLERASRRTLTWKKYLSLLPSRAHGKIGKLPLSEVSVARAHRLLKMKTSDSTVDRQTKKTLRAVVLMYKLRTTRGHRCWSFAGKLSPQEFNVIKLLLRDRLSIDQVKVKLKLESNEKVRDMNYRALSTIGKLRRAAQRTPEIKTDLSVESFLLPCEREVYHAYHTEGKSYAQIARERGVSLRRPRAIMNAAYKRIEHHSLMASLRESDQWIKLAEKLPARIRSLLELVYQQGRSIDDAGRCMEPPAIRLRARVLHQTGLDMVRRFLRGESITPPLPPDEVVAQLSPLDQKVLKLRVVERLSEAEISHALNRELSRQGTQRAIARIEALLKAQGHSISLTTRQKKA